jgi:single-strand DNA-binding protein
MNLCVFSGNFVRKPELKKVGAEQVSVINFTVAVNRKFNSKNGEQKKETTFIDCEAWDTGAETIAQFCNKGDYIIVYTTAKNESWQDNDGKKRSRVKFRVDRFEFVPGLRRREEETNEAAPDTLPIQTNNDDDIPF